MCEAGTHLDDPDIEDRFQIKGRWPHKKLGTPETWDRDGEHSDALIQLEKYGSLGKEQVEWAADIADGKRRIESDVLG